ncbi:hypothetical protein [Fibrella forsythiae]|uniref:Transposase n=1 Tax=Fibrella forsythiae TaxID=2817061 RepID=A0ABS3JBI7_9BACT|nr:hypothetical protein [Fibrella forsythiae]MBO0947352.1 hypothetical protein [Fibrella forsythiae]
MGSASLLTPYIKARRDKEQRIYNDYQQLISQPEAMPVVVDSILMKKYNIKSRSTIWSIRGRVQQRMLQSTNELNGKSL